MLSVSFIGRKVNCCLIQLVKGLFNYLQLGLTLVAIELTSVRRFSMLDLVQGSSSLTSSSLSGQLECWLMNWPGISAPLLPASSISVATQWSSCPNSSSPTASTPSMLSLFPGSSLAWFVGCWTLNRIHDPHWLRATGLSPPLSSSCCQLHIHSI